MHESRPSHVAPSERLRHPDAIARIAQDTELSTFAADARVSFALMVDGRAALTLGAVDGAWRPIETASPDFEIDLPEGAWSALLAPSPAPRTQHVLAHLAPRGAGAVLGDQDAFARHLHVVRRAIEVLRGGEAAAVVDPGPLDMVRGRYVRVEVPRWGICDVFVEEAGTGRPLLLLATAGSDSRQYHGLFREPSLTSQHRLIAFDLPWHGKSDPALGRNPSDYVLDSETYTACIAAVIEALELDEAPIVVGASMAGAVVVEMAARYPQLIAGGISSQAGPRVGNRHTSWLRDPAINQTLHVPEWTYGLMSPLSPKHDRDRVWWGYSQGGYGIYERDIAYYSHSWDIDHVDALIGDDTPPIVFLHGAFDYSVPPEATQELAGHLPRSTFVTMPGLGHFPHAEDPPRFAAHLVEALRRLVELAA